MGAIKTLLTIIQMLSCLALIGIVMTQATKSEGLSGTIGGKSESAFKGKPGSEEKLAEYTKWMAVAFFVISLVLAIVNAKLSA